MANGIIKRFDFRKGFGFIVDDKSGDDFFFHKSAWQGSGPIRLGLAVEFVSKESDKGPQADSVTPLEGTTTRKKKAEAKPAVSASLEERLEVLESSLVTWKALTVLALVGLVALGISIAL